MFLEVEDMCQNISLETDKTWKHHFFLSVLSLTHACCQSYIFKTFVLSFHGSNHLDDPSLFEAYIRPPL